MSNRPTVPPQYQCPGDSYPISQPVHLSRLANFHPKCRECRHSEDTASLSPSLLRQFDETRRRAFESSIFSDVGVLGVYRNQIDVTIVRRIAIAMGLACCDRIEDRLPHLVLASDGRPEIAELVAVASEGLRRTGCEVIDIGGATAACIQAAIADLRADGGMMVGNPTNDRRNIGLRFWSAGARPITRDCGLLEIQALYERGTRRGVREMGPIRRVRVEADYLGSLAPLYHALRPLRLVVDTVSSPVQRYWSALSSSVNCQMRWVDTPAQPRGDTPAQLPANTAPPGLLATTVLREKAHFGMAISGDGVLLAVLDEQAQAISPEVLGRVFDGGADDLPSSIWSDLDGIESISRLLKLISRDDRPLSRVLDELCFAGYDQR